MRQPRRVSRHLARQPFGTRRIARCPSSRHDRDRSPSRTTRRATTWFPPRRSARQARGPSRALAALLAVMVRLRPRATANVAYGAMRCVDRVRCCFAARHLVSTLGAAITRRALRPGHVACGDHCVRGTLPPRHHAGTNDLLSKALGATGRKAALAPRHYRIAPPGDMPRKATSAASGRRNGSDGHAPQTARSTNTATPQIIVSLARVRKRDRDALRRVGLTPNAPGYDGGPGSASGPRARSDPDDDHLPAMIRKFDYASWLPRRPAVTVRACGWTVPPVIAQAVT